MANRHGKAQPKRGRQAVIIKGVPADEFARIVAEISRRKYDGNVVLKYSPNVTNRRGDFTIALRCNRSDAPGARRSGSGRRSVSTCWHAFRDVFAEMFDRYPNAIVKSMYATYDGRDGFEENYPATARTNVGSYAAPRYVANMCECGERPVTAVLESDEDYPETDLADTVGDTIAEIDRTLAAVAAAGWTNPYSNPDSPAHQLV